MASRGAARFVRARFERLTGEPIDAWSGLQKLVDNQVPEGSELDYKLRPYDDPAKDKNERNDELRKDVTGLANAVGGVIVCGVSDANGLPGKLLGFTDSLDKLEGVLGSVIRTRIWPPVDGVDIVPVEDAMSSKGCLLIVVPPSRRAPHAVQPHKDLDALKYARRVGRHTEWLSETQVADLYRGRFTAAQSQSQRIDELLADLRVAIPRRSWLIVGLVPDAVGEFSVSRERVHDAQQWWDRRRMLNLLPGTDTGTADASAGPRRVVLSRSDGQPSAPTGVYAELHDDGSCGIALELREAPSGNPSFFLDDLVAQTQDAIVWAIDFAVGEAGSGGYGLLKAALHFPQHPDGEILAFDPSWSNARQLPRGTRHAVTAHTVDTEAIQASNTEAVAAAALVAGHIAQFFGIPDAQYLAPSGAVRVQQYRADVRDNYVIPRASALQVPMDMKL